MRVDIISRIFLFSLAVLLLLQPATAQEPSSFSVDVTALNDTITPDETAFFEIDVTNHMSSSQKFRLSSSDFRWKILSRDPRSDYFSGFTVGAGETYTVTMEYSPRGDLMGGRYNVRTEVESRDTDESAYVDIPIDVRYDSEDREYATTVVVDANVNKDDIIDPRETSTLGLELDNRNPLNISELDVEIESPFLNESFKTPLDPLEARRFEFNFDVDELTEPSVVDFKVVVKYDGETIGRTPVSFPVQILSYSEITRNVTEDGGFLSTSQDILLRNRGNVENEDEVRIETSLFSRVFTVADPEPQIITEDGTKYMYWNVEISPGSSAEIDVTVNYRPLLYVLMLAIVATFLYYMLRSPLVVKKSAAALNVKEEGISELKILIHVRNRTPKNFTAFSVSEYVPKIATYVKSDSLGSIQPTKVLNHEKKGTLLKWNFDAIEPFEERIIIYKMKLNFAVLGRLNLPPTTVKFKDELGSNYASKSNRLKILNSKEDESKEKRKGRKKNR
ncbi:MAG: hypothetical protein ACLFTR_02590 [Candidatus Woesearchaeota archaeon]